MSESFVSLLQEISAPAGAAGYNVKRLSDDSAYYLGRDGEGRACLLIEARGTGRTVPLQLAGIEAHFALDCRVQEHGRAEENKTLSVIVCMNRSSSIEAYFASVAELIVNVLGPAPSAEQVREAVDQLIQLFQKLQAAPRRPVLGLTGELCFIYFAKNPAAAVRAWRIDPDERFDFIEGSLRIDVKSTAQRQRVHNVSFDQANPPAGTRSLFVSLWIEPAGGGMTLSSFVAQIERKLANDTSSVVKLRAVVADTLGNSLPVAMNFRFDPRSAEGSLQIFDSASVPAIRPPIPTGLTNLHFSSDFAMASSVDLSELATELTSAEAALLP